MKEKKHERLRYVSRGHDILGYRCITVPGELQDKTLAGERGEIWRYNDTHCRAFVVLPTKSEKLITFENRELAKWILKLRIPSDPDKQVSYANNR